MEFCCLTHPIKGTTDWVGVFDKFISSLYFFQWQGRLGK